MDAPELIVPGKARRILFVGEEDASVRAGAQALRDRYDCIVDAVRDGAAACKTIGLLPSGQWYDVILADLHLPDMTGCELLVKLKAAMDDVPLVMMCGFGYDAAPMLAKARHAGLRGALLKPLRVDQLLETVARVVE